MSLPTTQEESKLLSDYVTMLLLTVLAHITLLLLLLSLIKLSTLCTSYYHRIMFPLLLP